LKGTVCPFSEVPYGFDVETGPTRCTELELSEGKCV
jgi:hypothetical protein